jgi:hypothetical protein
MLQNPITDSSMLEIALHGHQLVLNYILRSNRCSWSLYNTAGTEIMNGQLSGYGPYVVLMDQFPTGVYQICVMDGGQVHSKRFTKPV